MANEISITMATSLSKGNLRDNEPSKRWTVTMNGSRKSDVVQTVGTATHVAVTISADVSTNVGISRLLNLSTSTSTSDFVKFGLDNSGTFMPLGKLKPSGPPAQLQLATKEIYVQAYGAAQDIQVKVYDE